MPFDMYRSRAQKEKRNEKHEANENQDTLQIPVSDRAYCVALRLIVSVTQ